MFNYAQNKVFNFDCMYDMPDYIKYKASYPSFRKIIDEKVADYKKRAAKDPKGKSKIFDKILTHF